MKITLFGLGEAGSLIGADIAASGRSGESNIQIKVVGYDPADVATPAGIERMTDPAEAVRDADFILALTAASDATGALLQALDAIPDTAVYADFASASADLKRELAAHADTKNLAFCDVALMAMVPGNGIKATSLLSGTGAEAFAGLVAPLGMPVTVVSQQAGDAAQRKLLRSVAVKGLAAVLIESLEGAQAAGCAPWLWQNLCDEIGNADGQFMQRLVLGTETHAQRRLHEMQASMEQLNSLSVEPLMTRATVANLEKVLKEGVPVIPELG